MSETTLEDVKSEIQTLAGNIKDVAENALKQAQDGGKVAASAKEKANELLSKQGELVAKQTELETRMLEIEQSGASRMDRPARMTAGRELASSDALKAYVGNGASGAFRMKLENAITTTQAAGLMWSDRETDPVEIPRRMDLRIRDLLDSAPTSTDTIEYARQTVRDSNAAPAPEGTVKPESTYAWEKATGNVKTIAHVTNISRQALDDAARLQAELDSEMRYGLDLEIDKQIIAGDGTGENLLGLIPQATDYSAAFVPAAETIADKLMLAVLQASLTEYAADGIVLHPTDWARVALTKDADGNYILGGPQAAVNKTLWGVPVVTTKSIEVDKFLVGAFRMAGRVYDRMATEVLISSEHGQNFVMNMLTMRAEERLGLIVRRPAAMIYGDLGFAA